MKKLQSKVDLRGSKKKGWILTISDNYGYKEDLAITHEELLKIKYLLNNEKIK